MCFFFILAVCNCTLKREARSEQKRDNDCIVSLQRIQGHRQLSAFFHALVDGQWYGRQPTQPTWWFTAVNAGGPAHFYSIWFLLANDFICICTITNQLIINRRRSYTYDVCSRPPSPLRPPLLLHVWRRSVVGSSARREIQFNFLPSLTMSIEFEYQLKEKTVGKSKRRTCLIYDADERSVMFWDKRGRLWQRRRTIICTYNELLRDHRKKKMP